MESGTMVVMEILTDNVRVMIDTVLPPGLYKGAITASSTPAGMIGPLQSAVLILDAEALEQLRLYDDDLGTRELRIPVLDHILSGDIRFTLD